MKFLRVKWLCVVLPALALIAPTHAAPQEWKLSQTNVRATCNKFPDKTEVCLFKENGTIWLSVLTYTDYDFTDSSMIVQVDGRPFTVYRFNSATRPALVRIKSDDPKQPLTITSFRLHHSGSDFEGALKTGHLVHISTAPEMGPIWQVQVTLDGLAATLAQL